MAELACKGLMRTFDFKIGQSVIERLGIQIHHIVASTFVLCMAMLAVLSQLLVQPPVIAFAQIDIGLDLCMVMAGETAARLISLLQSLMTTFTLLFKLSMTFDDRPWHQQQIQLAGNSRHRARKQIETEGQQERLPVKVLHKY